MTDDKVVCEGPYKVEQLGARNRNEFVVIGPGWEKFCEIYTRSGAEKAAIFSNIAYSEGREAERERCLNVLKKYPDDWKVCGDILEAIRLEIKERS